MAGISGTLYLSPNTVLIAKRIVGSAACALKTSIIPTCTVRPSTKFKFTYNMVENFVRGSLTGRQKRSLGKTWTSTVARRPSLGQMVGRRRRSFHLWCFAVYVYIVLNVTEPNTFCQRQPFLLEAFYAVAKTRHASIQLVRVNGDSWWPSVCSSDCRPRRFTAKKSALNAKDLCSPLRHLVEISSCTETQWKMAPIRDGLTLRAGLCWRSSTVLSPPPPLQVVILGYTSSSTRIVCQWNLARQSPK